MTSRRRDQHRDWVTAHGDELSEIGLPFRVYESADRWSDFLQNGHLHWHEDAGHFSFEDLSAEQRAALHRFLEREHGQGEAPLLLGWLRVRAAPELNLRDGLVPRSAPDAIGWLASRGAHAWLVRHHELVVEAAEHIVQGIRRTLPIDLDADHVLLGAALHDAGKIAHPEEMRAPGHSHEHAGERMLRASGFPAHVARACVTHAAWSEPRAVLEDRLVALADKLWKGKRDEDLEDALVDEIAERTGRDRWEIFAAFDALCEAIADDGPDRLRRSDV
jgi:hypothetical protein